jgi:hypothetical protein
MHAMQRRAAAATTGNPAAAFEKTAAVLANPKAQWEETFKSLDVLRRVAAHHGDVIGPQALHALLLTVLVAINNLRSSVSKNALLCLGDLFRGLGRRMDPEVPSVLPDLLKRCADTNKFVNAEAMQVRAFLFPRSIRVRGHIPQDMV